MAGVGLGPFEALPLMVGDLGGGTASGPGGVRRGHGAAHVVALIGGLEREGRVSGAGDRDAVALRIEIHPS